MTLRITVVTDARDLRLIRLEGRLTADACDELEHAVGTDPKAVRLDLAGLRGADAGGVAELRRLRAWGVSITSIPPHLAWRIEGEEP